MLRDCRQLFSIFLIYFREPQENLLLQRFQSIAKSHRTPIERPNRHTREYKQPEDHAVNLRSLFVLIGWIVLDCVRITSESIASPRTIFLTRTYYS